ncbi:ABC transporter substrate-binding protein [Streptomyces fulvorobeus]|uniref:ABC-type branched-subunit amino acid transport system substrate-binding protein n=1 Tax=Streptomyces fulvorobeus TaxID=284028 RepID=A0A7J0C887_9ACTN|nr:ABC transporter substrate-binding protein [Streptomyces fulvorobeus]NYE42292.1 ABC-type branched-subunit amino acid transport system substrate-binding protein [Streptomyces fulvorobeus]GFM98681.1 lipoprotein [Streptomyces fulvorobeus]
MTGRRCLIPLRPSRLLSAAAVAGALLISGCGVLPGSSGSADQPVTVMTWAPERAPDGSPHAMAGATAMATAYARWVNEEGGIDGHELRVITCDEGDTLLGAGRCAREAVKRDAAAVVGSYSRHGQAFMAPLEAAGIPYIGGYGASTEEFTSYNSYPVNGGQSALLAGNGRQLAAGCDQVSLVRPDSISGDGMPPLLDTGLSEARGPRSVDILAPEDATSYAAQAAQALEKSGDGCVTAVLGDRTETFFDSFRRLEPEGSRVRVSSVLGSVGQPLIDRTGGRNSPFEGAYVTGWYPDSNDSSWSGMRRVIRTHAFADNRVDPEDTGVQTAWIAYTVLRAVIEAIDEPRITAGKVSSSLNRGTQVDTGGLTPVLRWRYKDMLGTSAYPRIINGQVTFQVVRDGRLVADRKGFVDVSETLSDAHSIN